jgi:hypothetical protein
MIRQFFLIFLFSCFSVIGYGQFEYQALTMSEGIHEAVLFNINQVDSRTVEKLWDDFIDEFGGKTKRKRREGEYQTEGASIVQLTGTKPVNVFFKAEDFGDNSRASVWFKTDGAFLEFSSNPGMQKQVETLLADFKHSIKVHLANEQMEQEEKKLKDLERELGKLERLKERYEKEIERAKKAIEDNEQNLEENQALQEAKTTEIEAQKQIVEKVLQMLNDLRTKQ